MAVEHGQILTFENVNIRARNFGGMRFVNPGSAPGKRGFGFDIDRDTALQLMAEGWPIKQTKPWEGAPEDWEPTFWMKVNVSFPRPGQRFRPPTIVQVSSRGNIQLDEEAISVLDWAQLVNADVSVRARRWVFGDTGTEGVSAELSELYVTFDESPLSHKYAENADSLYYQNQQESETF